MGALSERLLTEIGADDMAAEYGGEAAFRAVDFAAAFEQWRDSLD